MTKQLNVDQKFLHPLYQMAKAMENKEVPLMWMSEDDQCTFLNQTTAAFGGTVVYSAAADAPRQFLSSIGRHECLFLVVDAPLEKQVHDLVCYYLQARDVLGERGSHLVQKYQDHPIHPDHRLIQLVDRDVFERQPESVQRYLTKMSTGIVVA